MLDLTGLPEGVELGAGDPPQEAPGLEAPTELPSCSPVAQIFCWSSR